jgi:murein L,D-transpeptidase YcbB/YkuD
MERVLFGMIAPVMGLMLMLVLASSASAASVPSSLWTFADLMALDRWVEKAPQDALPKPSDKALRDAQASGEAQLISEEAMRLALELARLHLLGRASAKERSGWHIVDSDRETALEPLLFKALASKDLDAFFEAMRPSHPEYARLQAAYLNEGEAERQLTLARNMERWRWMPRDLGPDYVLVNAARFEAVLWRGGERSRSWRVIVGKPRTPTPVFSAQIEGVIFNPWWNIPASIVRESVGALVRRDPAVARARGYVWEDGRYRQKPGPGNALG